MMETQISEEDLLSGIELLPTTEPNTPNNMLSDSGKLTDSNLSILSDNMSPEKSFHMSPVKISTKVQSLSDTAFQVQKQLQDSLASSLRKEVEIKTHWQASPGEVHLADKLKRISDDRKQLLHAELKHGSTIPLSGASVYTSVLSRANLLTLPITEAALPCNEISESLVNESRPHRGPNICLSDQFPSGISPIKVLPESSPGKISSKTSAEVGNSFAEDPNTKKLLEFIQRLEKAPNQNESIAEQMAQLSVLLKNSSINNGKIPATDHDDQIVNQNIPQKEGFLKTTGNPDVKQVEATNQNRAKSLHAARQHQKSKQTIANARVGLNMSKPNVLSKQKELPDPTKDKDNQQRTFGKTSVKSANSKTVQFVQAAKHDGQSRSSKASHKSGRSKASKPSEDRTSVGDKPQKLNEKPQNPKPDNPPSKAVQDMHTVRNHLQTMLNLHKIDPLILDSSGGDMHNGTHDSKGEDTCRSNDTSTLLRAQPVEMISFSPSNDVTGDMTDSLTSGIFSILKSGNMNQPTSGRSSIDSSLAAENGILRDTLEKETYRRKHCEKQIQKLQKNTLEIQQELAVAHSTDRKKDLMIEQLDKTLAKVVEGWKSHEANLVKSVEQLTKEKENGKEETIKLKEMLVNLENELAKVLEELVDEKERMLQVEEKEKSTQLNYQARTEEIAQVIDQKNETLLRFQAKNEELIEEKKLLKQAVDELTQDSEDQKKLFMEKEGQWEEAVIELEKRQKEILKQEKTQTEQERKRCSDIQSTLASSQQEIMRLEGLLEAQRNEVESMHTQAAVVETKHLADVRKLEAEHKMSVEKQIMDKLTHLHEEAQSNESRIREAHKKQVMDLIDSHKRELESQCRRYEDEIQKRDDQYRSAISHHEKSLNDKLKSKSDGMRQQMLSKMQNLLQAHYNETLQVVGNTTGVTPQRPPASNQPSLRYADDSFMSSAAYDAFNSRTLNGEMLSSMNRSQLAAPPTSLHSASIQSQLRSDFSKTVASISSNEQHKSAFTFTTSLAQPSEPTFNTSSFQPLTSAVLTNVQPPIPRLPNDLPAVPTNSFIEELEIEEEALPNLSLISSISHSTVTSAHHKDHPRPIHHIPTAAPVCPAGTLPNSREIYMPEKHVNRTSTISQSKMEQVQSNEQEGRQLQLQHYVQMLLQRSPGDPTAPSSNDQSPERDVNQALDDDKENAGIKLALPMTSYPQNNTAMLMQLMNQQRVEASPDMVPVKQNKTITGDQPTRQSVQPVMLPPKSTVVAKTKPLSGSVVRRSKPNVTFAQDSVKMQQSHNEMPSAAQNNFLSPAQMSEISEMLGLYSTSQTPTGETRLAAEQLLNYLRDNKAPIPAKSSIQPTVTSSPVKRKQPTDKPPSRPADFQLCSLAQPGGKPRPKSGMTSPAKPTPAWR